MTFVLVAQLSLRIWCLSVGTWVHNILLCSAVYQHTLNMIADFLAIPIGMPQIPQLFGNAPGLF
jgi:hypothetical protein